MFKRPSTQLPATVDFRQLGFREPVHVRDIWKAEDLGTMKDPYTVTVLPHGAVFLPVK